MMKFALLASGSKGNCFVLANGTDKIAVDCGTTRRYLVNAFKTIHMEINDLDALLITHTHTDHISQIRLFKDRPIYTPVPLDIEQYQLIEPLLPIQIGSIKVTPIRLSHDAHNTTGYIFETEDEKLVYITDTGYIREDYLPLISDPDYMILESNHDIDLLMHTARPQYVKIRIAGDSGHLCNEVCAEILDKVITKRTRMVLLAHISEQGNSREKALQVSAEKLLKRKDLNPELILYAAGQYDIVYGGEWKDETIINSPYCASADMECLADL